MEKIETTFKKEIQSFEFSPKKDDWPPMQRNGPFIKMKFGGKFVNIPKGLEDCFQMYNYTKEPFAWLKSYYNMRMRTIGIPTKINIDKILGKPRKRTDVINRLECWDLLFKNQNYHGGTSE